MIGARWLAPALLVLAAGRSARADDPTPEERRALVEDAFLDERFEEVRALAAANPLEYYPRFLLDSFWRPRGLRASGKKHTLEDRRLAWDGVDQRYPMPGPGEVDPYPRLTALVLDRLRREQQGARGLPDESPLAAIADARIQSFIRLTMRPALLGTMAGEKSKADREREEAIRDTAARNRRLALAGVAGLILAAGLAFALARPGRRPGGGA